MLYVRLSTRIPNYRLQIIFIEYKKKVQFPVGLTFLNWFVEISFWKLEMIINVNTFILLLTNTAAFHGLWKWLADTSNNCPVRKKRGKKDIHHWKRVSGQTLMIIIFFGVLLIKYQYPVYMLDTLNIFYCMSNELDLANSSNAIDRKEWQNFVMFDIGQSSFCWLKYRITLHLFCPFLLFLFIRSPIWANSSNYFQIAQFFGLKNVSLFPYAQFTRLMIVLRSDVWDTDTRKPFV